MTLTTYDLDHAEEQERAQAAKHERLIHRLAVAVGIVLGLIALKVWL